MSWENDEYVADVAAAAPAAAPAAAAAPKPSSAERKKKAETILRAEIGFKVRALTSVADKDHTIELPGKGLTTLPVDAPNYATCKYLILRDNAITTLNTALLPRGLAVLDLRSNGLLKIVGDFPDSIQFLFLDDNRLREIPAYSPYISEVTFTNNPLKKTNSMAELLENYEDRTTLWITTEPERAKLSPEDVNMLGTSLLIFPEDVFRRLCEASKVFMRRSICRNIIGTSYVHTKLEKTDHLILEVKGKDIEGLAIFEFQTPNPPEILLYVHLLCSSVAAPGGGTRIMNMLKAYFKNHPELAAIRLDSVGEAKGFYTKIGFVPCFEGQLCPMEFRRAGLPASAPRRSRSRSKSKSKSANKTAKAKAKAAGPTVPT
jgi:hypothetical protein